MNKILIAGYGYVGKSLAPLLAARGHEVTTLGRRAIQPEPVRVGKIRHAVADVARPETLRELPTVDTVIYMVSPDEAKDETYVAAYVRGLRNVLENFSDLRRAIFVSSTAVYEQRDGEPVDENTVVVPEHFRGRRLLEAESVLAEHPAEGIALRLGGIYGPGRDGFVRRVANGKTRIPATPRYQNRIHRHDCAGILAHLVHLPNPERLYLGVDCEPAPVGEVITWMAAKLGRGLPSSEGAEAKPSRRFTNKRCSNARILASGYAFQYPTYRDGYAPLIGALRAEYRPCNSE